MSYSAIEDFELPPGKLRWDEKSSIVVPPSNQLLFIDYNFTHIKINIYIYY